MIKKMDAVKAFGGILEQLFESLKPMTQIIVAFAMGVFAHLDVCASVIAVLVLLFQLKVSYYKGKREKVAYDKECQGK